MNEHIEAEVKFEISVEERAMIEDIVKELGFADQGTEALTDLVFNRRPSEKEGSQDFDRIRLKAKAIFNPIGETKVWINRDGNWLREEHEFPIVVMNKLRTTYALDGFHIVLDLAWINEQERHFVEVEKLVSHDEAENAYKEVEKFARENLRLGDRPKAPSYLKLFGFK